MENALRDAKLSMKDINEVILVGGSTRIPSVINVVRTMCGKEPNASVNPDEVVALGAAVQAGGCDFSAETVPVDAKLLWIPQISFKGRSPLLHTSCSETSE